MSHPIDDLNLADDQRERAIRNWRHTHVYRIPVDAQLFQRILLLADDERAKRFSLRSTFTIRDDAQDNLILVFQKDA